MKNQSKIVSFFALVIFIIFVFFGFRAKMNMDSDKDLGQNISDTENFLSDF